MDTFETRRERSAFTVLELLVIIVVVFVLALALLPALMAPQRPRHRLNCVNNLKQISLSFRLWAGDNGDKYPQSHIGDPKYPLMAPLDGYAATPGSSCLNTYLIFKSMSNELSTPKLLVCPKDQKRTFATNFTTDFNNRHLSYFAGLDSDETRPDSFLAGDWNITNGQQLINGMLFLQSNQNVGWTKELHNCAGSLALGDGSVQQITNKMLKGYLIKSGLATNRILLP